MALRSKEELLKIFGDLIGDRNDDEVIAFMEDLADSFGDDNGSSIEKLKNDYDKLKQKYDESEENWRRKYRERFYSGEGDAKTEEMVEKPDSEKEDDAVEKMKDFVEKGGI